MGVQESQEDVAREQVHLCEFRGTFSVAAEQNRDAKSTHSEYSSLLLRVSITSFSLLSHKGKPIIETIQYRVLLLKAPKSAFCFWAGAINRAFNYHEANLDYPKSPTY